ncbi:MAG: hypothetical protein NDJ89_15540 [Oligoflexia bacterium]|nr:hypothetical protein [Oligoflexia bacterium]
MSKTLLTLGLLLLSLAGAPVAHAAGDAEIQEQVGEIIRQRHPTDTPETWRGLGPAAPRNIIEMYLKSDHILHRVRLLQGLGWFDTPEASEFLKAQASATNEDAIRTTAVRSVAHSQGAKETEFLAKFLEHPDVQTRFAAADALKRLNDPRADELVASYLKKEKAPWIAGKLEGRLPEPKGRSTPEARTEGRLSAEFHGEWRGFWLLPKGPQEPGLSSDEATFKLRLEGDRLHGELAISGKPGSGKAKPKVFRLERVTGRATKISGVLVGSSRTPLLRASPAPSEELEFEAEIGQEAGSFLLTLRASRLGATLVARRTPVR